MAMCCVTGDITRACCTRRGYSSDRHRCGCAEPLADVTDAVNGGAAAGAIDDGAATAGADAALAAAAAAAVAAATAAERLAAVADEADEAVGECEAADGEGGIAGGMWLGRCESWQGGCQEFCSEGAHSNRTSWLALWTCWLLTTLVGRVVAARSCTGADELRCTPTATPAVTTAR